MSSYQTLEHKLGFEQALPFTADWSAAEDFLTLIADYCLETKPTTIVECSSGLSTLVLARCCQLNQHGKVYSLENGAEYAANTRQQLEQFKLEACATVIDAPLETVTLNGTDYQWYQKSELPDSKIDMLVIDGPPGFLQKNSRYPALPLLKEKLADHCSIFLDDAARADEQAIVSLWQKENSAITQKYIATERGCTVLSIHP